MSSTLLFIPFSNNRAICAYNLSPVIRPIVGCGVGHIMYEVVVNADEHELIS